MFITIKVDNKVRSINTDHISVIEEIISEVKLYWYRLVDGSEFQIDEESYAKLMNLLVNDAYEELPNQMQPKPSELSILLTELHKLLGGRGEAKFTTDRKARLTTRLKDFSPEELRKAATSLGSDEFMQGANDNGKRYGTIDYLIRTSANVNKWLEEEPQKKKGMF